MVNMIVFFIKNASLYIIWNSYTLYINNSQAVIAPRTGLGLIHYKQEKLKMAETYFRRSYELNPTSCVVLCHLGIVSCRELLLETILRNHLINSNSIR